MLSEHVYEIERAQKRAHIFAQKVQMRHNGSVWGESRDILGEHRTYLFPPNQRKVSRGEVSLCPRYIDLPLFPNKWEKLSPPVPRSLGFTFDPEGCLPKVANLAGQPWLNANFRARFGFDAFVVSLWWHIDWGCGSHFQVTCNLETYSTD